MMVDVHIRSYKPEDFDQVMSLWVATGLGNPQRGDNQKIVEHSISLGGELLVAVTPSHEVVGTAWMTFDGRRLHLHHFGVLPKYQRRGIGDLLTRESLRFAKRKGYQIKLEVHQSNAAAIALYKKHGFQFLGDYDVYIVRDIQSIDG
ncbi:MAG: N-acetyltransferase [Bacteroidales bacterium]|nr:N-acetyltransferase [Bacteroidales bacterium]